MLALVDRDDETVLIDSAYIDVRAVGATATEQSLRTGCQCGSALALNGLSHAWHRITCDVRSLHNTDHSERS